MRAKSLGGGEGDGAPIYDDGDSDDVADDSSDRCRSKEIFWSVDILVEFLASSPDEIYRLALETLSHLSVPPSSSMGSEGELRRSKALHSYDEVFGNFDGDGAHVRILACARG